jgi:hypothetical protein
MASPTPFLRVLLLQLVSDNAFHAHQISFCFLASISKGNIYRLHIILLLFEQADLTPCPLPLYQATRL